MNYRVNKVKIFWRKLCKNNTNNKNKNLGVATQWENCIIIKLNNSKIVHGLKIFLFTDDTKDGICTKFGV